MLAAMKRIGSRLLADRRYLYVYAQRAFVSVGTRQRLAAIEAKLVRHRTKLGMRSDALALAEQLQAKGHTEPFRLFSPEEATAIRSHLEKLHLSDPYRPRCGRFTIYNIPPETHVAHVDASDLARVPGVMAAANNPTILTAIQWVFRCAPTLDYVAAWWSMPGHSIPEEAQSFHRDIDTLNFIKVFIHLTDVDESSGPHVYVAGSHKRNRRNESQRRCADEDMTKDFGADSIVTFTGPAGTCFLENTFGFHKGALPKDKRRLILQFVYTVRPTVHGPVKPFLGAAEMPSGFDPYINRRFVKPS